MAEQVKDLYAVLGVEKEATEKDIKKAYRNLSKTKHPDVCDEPNAEESFQKIVEAYKVLSDPDARKEYDDFVRSMKDGSSKTFEEIFKDFNSGIQGAHTPIRGESIEVEVNFTVEEIRREAEKTIQFDRFINCESCEGHGFKRLDADVCFRCQGHGYSLEETTSPFGDIKVEKRCASCTGRGYVNVKECASCIGKGKLNILVDLTYSLPKETVDGYRYVLKGRGDEGINGGNSGDLILVLKQSEMDEYRVTNTYDLHKTVQAPYLKTLTGGKVSIAVPRGEIIDVPIPRGAQKGHQLILPDEGLFNPQNGFYGTLTLHLEIELPQSLSDSKVKKLIEILS